MVHCPECDHTLATKGDVSFTDLDSEGQDLFSLSTANMAKRFYVISCRHCDHVIGSGVAGANKTN